MNRRLFIQAGAVTSIILTTPFVIAARAQNQMATGTNTPNSPAKRHKIVIQVSDSEHAKWNLALNNAKNLQDDVGAANVDIEIVAYGPGMGMLRLESPSASRVAEAGKNNIDIVACENTMRTQKLTREDMLSGIRYVPAGATEIMTKQGQGWAYLRP